MTQSKSLAKFQTRTFCNTGSRHLHSLCSARDGEEKNGNLIVAESILNSIPHKSLKFGVGLGEVAGKVFRIGHLGMLTDAMMLSGLGVAEMVMKDLGLDIKLGSGVGAAQEFYRFGA